MARSTNVLHITLLGQFRLLWGETIHFRDWARLVRLIEPFVAPAAPAPIPSELEETSHDDLCF
jgi:hypothetical protein